MRFAIRVILGVILFPMDKTVKTERHIFSFAQTPQALILFMLHLLTSCQYFIFFLKKNILGGQRYRRKEAE